MMKRVFIFFFAVLLFAGTAMAQRPPAPLPSSVGTAYVIRAGRLIDP